MVTLTRTDRKARRPAAAKRAVLGGIAAGLVLGAAACGSAVAGSAGSGAAKSPSSKVNPGGPMVPASVPAHSALCAAIPHMSRLAFTRALSAPSHVRETLPLGFTIKDAAAVRQVATLLCGLPSMPPGFMSCPNLNGGSYQLFFVAGGRSFKAVDVQLSGCRTVTGLGTTRTWARSPRLGQQLSQALGKHYSLKGLEPPPA
jgi:hypothetical protein